MKKKIGEIEFELPNSTGDLTLNQYSAILLIEEKLNQYSEQDGLKFLFDWFSALTSVEVDILEELPFYELIQTINETRKKLTDKPLKSTKKKVIQIEDRKFYIPENNSLSFGDVLSIQKNLEVNENSLAKSIPVICAILFRERNEAGDRKKLEKTIEEIEENRLSLFREKLLVKDFIEPVNFFLNGLTDKINAMNT